MGYSIVIGKMQRPLATISGWKQTKGFIDNIDVDKYVEVVRFAEWAECTSLPAFERQLETLLTTEPPADKAIRCVLQGLLESLRRRPCDSVIAFVSDGMSSDIGEVADYIRTGLTLKQLKTFRKISTQRRRLRRRIREGIATAKDTRSLKELDNAIITLREQAKEKNRRSKRKASRAKCYEERFYPTGELRSAIFYRNEDWEPVGKSIATQVEIVEYDEKGNNISRTYGLINRGRRSKSS